MQVDLQVVTRDAKLAWDGSPTLRAEFGGNESWYLAYRHAEARGVTRSLSPTVVRGRPEEPLGSLTLSAPLAFQTGALVTLSGSTRGRIAGYGAVWGGTNRKGLRLMPGTFREATARVPLSILYGHSHDKVIGHWDSLREDGRGLFAEGTINLNISAGRDAFELISGQDVTGLSVGFRIKPGGAKQVGDVLEVTEADLLEISVCPVPAEDRARVFNVQGA